MRSRETQRHCSRDQSHRTAAGRFCTRPGRAGKKERDRTGGKGAPASLCNENVATLAWEGRVVKARGGSGGLTRKGFNQNRSRSPAWITGEEARGDQSTGRREFGGGPGAEGG